MIFGNFADLVIGFWNQFELLVDPYTDFAKASVRIRVIAKRFVALDVFSKRRMFPLTVASSDIASHTLAVVRKVGF